MQAPVSISGTATTTETAVAIPSFMLRGTPGSVVGAIGRPTPKALPTYFKGDLRIQNLDGTNTLIVRINGSTSVITIKPGAVPLTLRNIVVSALTVKSGAATVAYDIVGGASA